MKPSALRLVVMPTQRVGHPVYDVFRLVAAGQWRLGESRFTAAEVEGRVEFLGADGRSLGRAFDFTLVQLRAELASELPLRRGWLRARRPLEALVECNLDGACVAVRLREDALRTRLLVEFLVPRDDTCGGPACGPGHFSV